MQALKLWSARGYKSKEALEALRDELKAYIDQTGPFGDIQLMGESLLDVLSYWRTIGSRHAIQQLSGLAQCLLSIPPHGAAVERLFSRMGYTHNPTRNRMHSATLLKLVAIQVRHLHACKGAQHHSRTSVRVPACGS